LEQGSGLGVVAGLPGCSKISGKGWEALLGESSRSNN